MMSSPYAFRSSVMLYEGKAIDRLPQLLVDGMQPAHIDDIVRLRLARMLSTQMSYDSGDAILSHPSKGVKVVRGTPALWDIIRRNPQKIDDGIIVGGVVLEDGVFEQTNADLELPWQKADAYAQPMTREQAVRNPVWKTLISDVALRSTYADTVSTLRKDKQIMRIWFWEKPSVPIARLFGISGCQNDGSYLGSRYLTAERGRLVGVLR